MDWLHHHIPADKAYSRSMKELKERKGIKVTPALQFFSVSLVHFSDQNFQNYLFNIHIIVSLVHVKKAVSHFFE